MKNSAIQKIINYYPLLLLPQAFYKHNTLSTSTSKTHQKEKKKKPHTHTQKEKSVTTFANKKKNKTDETDPKRESGLRAYLDCSCRVCPLVVGGEGGGGGGGRWGGEREMLRGRCDGRKTKK